MRADRCRTALRGAALLGVLWAAGCGGDPDRPAPAAADAAGAPEPELRLDGDQIARAGIQVAVAEERSSEPEIAAYGRVLDPALPVEAITSREAARAAFEAARRERERLEALARGDQNASAREVEASRAAAARAQADLALADTRLAGLLGAAAREDADLDSLARRLARREVALVRVDVPAGDERPQPDQGAHLVAYPDGNGALEARYLGPAPEADPMLPGWGFLFLVDGEPPPVGTSVRARLHAAEPTLSGVEAPASALVQQAGKPFAFIERTPGVFERRAVVARALPDGSWLLTRGVAPGERLVVAGAAQLLSAERLAASGADAGE